MTISPTSVPDFDDLPKVEGMPQGCSWGIFDTNGKKDLHGTLNFLTPEIVAAAAKEITHGVSISLNWPLNASAKMSMTPRKQPEHKVLYIPQDFPGLDDLKPGEGKSWDDEISFNTQISSQWDSFCHYQHQHTGLAYNGFNPSRDSLAKDALEKNPMPTLEHWHERGGLIGRGTLLDYKGYCDDSNKSFDPMDGSSISIDDLEACATHFGVEFRPGDVLLVRTGYTEAVDTMTANGTTDQASGKSSGLENSVQVARWLWNKRFAAVASDAVALETMPPKKPDGSVGFLQDLVLHPYMLSCFGMPIGEMWDLKELARYCRDNQRYSFMITSVPLNMPGLIGSPPNAMAIF